MVRGSNLYGGQILCTHPDQLWGPPALLYSGYRVYPEVKRPERGIDHPLPFSAEVKERLELCLTPLLGFRGLLWGELYLYYIFCVCRHRYSAWNAHALCYIICGLSDSAVFFHIISLPAPVQKKVNEQKMCFDFLCHFCMKHFSFKEEMSVIW
jgi:hypothetical protein